MKAWEAVTVGLGCFGKCGGRELRQGTAGHSRAQWGAVWPQAQSPGLDGSGWHGREEKPAPLGSRVLPVQQ